MFLSTRPSLAIGTLANMNPEEEWKVKVYWSLLSLADFVSQLPCLWLLARLWNIQGQAMPVIPVDNEVPSSIQMKRSSSDKWLEQCYFLALIYVVINFEAKNKPIQISNVERRPRNCNSKSLMIGNDCKTICQFLIKLNTHLNIQQFQN